jgi:pilus assembly protein Flp/PilA
MLSLFRRLMKNEQGATMIEYTLITLLGASAAAQVIFAAGVKASST